MVKSKSSASPLRQPSHDSSLASCSLMYMGSSEAEIPLKFMRPTWLGINKV